MGYNDVFLFFFLLKRRRREVPGCIITAVLAEQGLLTVLKKKAHAQTSLELIKGLFTMCQ